MKRFLVTIGLMIISFLWGASSIDCAIPIGLTDALPRYIPRHEPCVPADASDIEQANLALAIIQSDKPDLSLLIGAEKYLAFGASGTQDRRCLWSDIIAKAAKAESVIDGFNDYGNLDDYQIRLAAQISSPDPKIVRSIAASSYLSPGPPSRYYKRVDVRPAARTVLAGFGRDAAAPYAERASKEMSAADSLGTSAAQIAAAAGYPGALSRIEEMMKELLRKTPQHKPVPYNVKHRFYELVYALYFAGPEGLAHLEPVRNIMTREVIKLAGEFGSVAMQPKQMCHLFDLMEGEERSEAKNYPFCQHIDAYDN